MAAGGYENSPVAVTAKLLLRASARGNSVERPEVPSVSMAT
jgi:hypothetical protein